MGKNEGRLGSNTQAALRRKEMNRLDGQRGHALFHRLAELLVRERRPQAGGRLRAILLEIGRSRRGRVGDDNRHVGVHRAQQTGKRLAGFHQRVEFDEDDVVLAGLDGLGGNFLRVSLDDFPHAQLFQRASELVALHRPSIDHECLDFHTAPLRAIAQMRRLGVSSGGSQPAGTRATRMSKL